MTWPQATPTLSYAGRSEASNYPHYNKLCTMLWLAGLVQRAECRHSSFQSSEMGLECVCMSNQVIMSGNIKKVGKIVRLPQSQYGLFLMENLTQCLLETEKKSLSMTNMKMIDQVCYSLCDKFTTITSFCDNLLCKEGSARRYYRHNDTFTFSIYSITTTT